MRRGALDLDLHATVLHDHLHAPGKPTLTNLEPATDRPLATFAAVPRKAVLAAMTEKGRLEVKFIANRRRRVWTSRGSLRTDDPLDHNRQHIAMVWIAAFMGHCWR